MGNTMSNAETAITEQTIEELKIRQRVHDNGMNEGGYGYNPYRDEIERRERDEWEAERRRFDEITKTNAMKNTASRDGQSGCVACCKTPNRNAQIWEPCEHCGNEPVYM